jgi:uncharacterized protein YjbJ (UPF0337 family)
MDKDRIVGTTKDYAGKAEGTVGDLTGDLGTQAGGRIREAAGTAQSLYGQAKDAARGATEAAGTHAKQAYENSGDAFREGSEALARKVRDNPLGSVLLAGGIGFALALLMMRPVQRPRRRGGSYYG